MSNAVIAGKAPIPVDVEAGKAYYYCTCGKSDKQPFCNGAHKGSEFTPLAWTAPESKTVYFCACKQTGTAPLCNGAHKSL